MSTPPLAHETDVFRQRARLMLSVTARAWGLDGCRMSTSTTEAARVNRTSLIHLPFSFWSFAL
ncbi:MAG: hypothetical protein RLZZ612_1307 [Pseudomonadota bacterium]|jgi:hypothetical protein